MEPLTSLRNPALVEIRKAVSRGTLTEDGFCVAEGFHLLEEALESGCEISSVFCTDAAAGKVEEKLQKEDSVRLATLSEAAFHSISSTETSQGVIALVRPPHWSIEDLFGRESPLLVLDGIQDPGNAGAILRAAEAFLATGVVLLKGCVYPYNPKALRASAGSGFRVPLAVGMEEAQLLALVQERNIKLFALEQTATDLVEDALLNRSCAVAIGSEGHGVSPAVRQASRGLRIPTHGVESLNAAMAATVLMYESHRQLVEKTP